ncbi:MAG: hypothetical protein IT379_37865 [Deltaproteobacteria bacterium]|nr:hypothetical protein [Deltaproteobacteria bacterium]
MKAVGGAVFARVGAVGLATAMLFACAAGDSLPAPADGGSRVRRGDAATAPDSTTPPSPTPDAGGPALDAATRDATPPACAPGQVECPGGCTDLSSNASSCGVCGNACGDGRRCAGGVCVCAPGRAHCDGTCVELGTDEHCSGCGDWCQGGFECVDGACGCPAPKTLCSDSVCANLQTSRFNCGACGRSCGGGTCTGGVCG